MLILCLKLCNGSYFTKTEALTKPYNVYPPHFISAPWTLCFVHSGFPAIPQNYQACLWIKLIALAISSSWNVLPSSFPSFKSLFKHHLLSEAYLTTLLNHNPSTSDLTLFVFFDVTYYLWNYIIYLFKCVLSSPTPTRISALWTRILMILSSLEQCLEHCMWGTLL